MSETVWNLSNFNWLLRKFFKFSLYLGRAFWRLVMVPRDIREHFDFMDLDHDGLVSKYEYTVVHQVFFYLQLVSCVGLNDDQLYFFGCRILLLFRYSFSSMEVDNFFKKYDSNHDYRVSAKEMASESFDKEVKEKCCNT